MTSARPVWDAKQGVWVGDRALSDDDAPVPEPLYIFGYGSLMWRPQDSFKDCHKVDGVVHGWRRLWAQRSTDHRGTPEKPGLVCTMLPDSTCESLSLRQRHDPPSSIHGVAYLIPQDRTKAVLDELDFREKGGYTRAGVDVHTKGSVIRALVYTANQDNGNFYLPTPDEAAHIAAWSHGPSGRNRDYLFQVAGYLKGVGADCTETCALADRVVEVLDRGLDLRPRLDRRYKAVPPISRLRLKTWGSNQHKQLGCRVCAPMDDINDEWPRAEDCYVDLDVAQPVRDGRGAGVVQVAAGGGHSAVVLEGGSLYMWGWGDAGQTGVTVDDTSRAMGQPPAVWSPSDGFGDGPHAEVKEGVAGERTDGGDVSPSFIRPFPRHVAMVALGHSHTLVIEERTGKIYGLGSNADGEATGTPSVRGECCREEGGAPVAATAGTDMRIVHCAAGVKHSAAVTDDGHLLTWGGGKHGQCLPQSVPQWRPPDGARVLKVACGWRHTLILDAQHRVWTLGWNKYGQRALGSTPLEDVDVAMPTMATAWEGRREAREVHDIACGWSHNLALVRGSGGNEVWGWGRNDFNQLGRHEGAEREIISSPRLVLAELPGGLVPVGVCCGSESSLIVAHDGSVWAFGWNEHGNLGTGDKVNHAVPQRVEVGRQRRGASDAPLIACGGAHVLWVDADERAHDLKA